jgi:hypothetical protein
MNGKEMNGKEVNKKVKEKEGRKKMVSPLPVDDILLRICSSISNYSICL